MEKILDTEFAIINHDKNTNSIITIWKRPTTSEDFRTVFSIILDKMKEHKAETFVNDICQLGLVGTEDRTWLQKEIIPQAFAAGLRKLATVATNDVFSRFYVDQIQNGEYASSNKLEFRYFDDLTSAQRWIGNQDIAA